MGGHPAREKEAREKEGGVMAFEISEQEAQMRAKKREERIASARAVAKSADEISAEIAGEFAARVGPPQEFTFTRGGKTYSTGEAPGSEDGKALANELYVQAFGRPQGEEKPVQKNEPKDKKPSDLLSALVDEHGEEWVLDKLAERG